MDIQYLLLLQSFRDATGGIFNSFFLLITRFGETMIPISIALIFYYAVNKKVGSFMLVGNGTGTFVNGVLKLTACVYRPWVRDARVIPAGDAKVAATGYSFPSGHSTTATSIYGSAAAFYRKRTGLCISFLIVMVLVLFSRNYLGVHTPQDVLVGFSATAIVLLILYAVLQKVEKSANGDIIFLAVCVVLAILALVYFTHKSYPLDYDAQGNLIVDPKKKMPDSFSGAGFFLGAVAGWFIERRWIHFSTDTDTETKLIRCITGILLFFVLSNTISTLWINAFGVCAGKFINAFITFLYVTAIHPLIFTAIEKRRR